MFKLLALLFVYIFSHAHGQFEGDTCMRAYDNSPGICKNVRNCPKAREEHRQGVPLTICAYLGGQPVICCPESGGFVKPTSNNGQKRISLQKCEQYSKLTMEQIFVNSLSLVSNQHAITTSKCVATTPLIVGGEKTRNGEFPHMAAIGYRNDFGDSYNFKCGGSLISENFVLTAAHCKDSRLVPSFVRLGDQNLVSRQDGLREVDIDIANFIKHENYRTTSDGFDIALIKLVKNVQFSEFIRPACLWQSSSMNTSKTIATGWGNTEELGGSTSDELMKVELDIIENSKCQKYFDETVINSQMCAGVLTGKKDTCQGDSGGPIQVTTPSSICVYHIIGITSFGSTVCAQRDSPGVYTRVASYLDWIESKVW